MWHIDDLDVRLAVVFVPAGEPLPTEPARWHMRPTQTNEDGIPVEFGVCNTDHTPTVREFLAREAEEGIR
jgi:hypothetical protein